MPRHYHVTAHSGRHWLAQPIATYLGALDAAKRLVVEALPEAGHVLHGGGAWVVLGADGSTVASITLQGPCFAHHSQETREEAPALQAA